MTDSETLVVDSHITLDDFAALQKAWAQRARAQAGRIRLYGAATVPIVTGLLLAYLLGAGGARVPFGAYLLGLCAAVFANAGAARLFRRSNLPAENGLVLGRVRTELSSEGIRTVRECSEGLTRWSALRDVTRTPTHVFLWVDRTSAYTLPLRDLPPELDAAAVVARVRSWAGTPAAPVERPETSAPAAPAGEPAPAPPAPALGFLATLARRLTWRRVRDHGVGSSDAMIFACAIVALAVWLAFDRYAAGPGAMWFGSGVVGITWYAAGLVALAWVLHRASHGTARFRVLLASVVAGLPLPLALALAVDQWAPEGLRSPALAVLGIAAAVYVGHSLLAATGGRLFYAMPLAALLVLAFAHVTGDVWVDPHVWYAYPDDEESLWAHPEERERLFFEQADRIDAAVADLRAGEPGRPDVFFLGFAGVAEEKVFAEEIQLAADVISQRYGAAGRTLLLVNDRRDRTAHPLASVQGLRRALAGMAERMDLAEDVLFLMLTSHGSKAPTLSVSNGEWPLQQLDAETLGSALDEAGIRWRVIVISACYSGGFIETLADESTIVLTSAAADRASFGCSDARDVTEFGAALVRDALPQAPSLASAFEEAKRALEERERLEGVTPSLPQAHFGSAIGVHWGRVEAEHAAPDRISDGG